MKKSLLVLAGIFILKGGISQAIYSPGYVVTIKGDTLKGEIKRNPKRDVEMFFKVNLKISETEKKTFKPLKLKEYGIDSLLFVTKKVDEEFVFFKVLSKGALNLYVWQYEWLTPKNDVVIKSEFFVEKGDTEALRLKPGKFKKQLSDVMSDNDEMIKKLDEKEIEYEQIEELVKQYNTSTLVAGEELK